MLERTRARRQALQILYQREITDQTVSVILGTGTYSIEDGEPSEFCRSLALGTETHQAAIDAQIEATSQHWSLMRMPFVDRNILRLAVFEILFADDVPDSVVINEAVEMAKVYGGEDSSKFVNGVLGRIAEVHAGVAPVDGAQEPPQSEGQEDPSRGEGQEEPVQGALLSDDEEGA